MHFVMLPRLSLERSLKISETEYKKPIDINMLLDYENCVRVDKNYPSLRRSK